MIRITGKRTLIPGGTPLLVLLWAALSLFAPPGASAQTTCYEDRGVEVCFPQGDISFADAVVAYEMGDPKPIELVRFPEKSLAPPDWDPAVSTNTSVAQNYVTLGCGGTLTLRFTDNALIDVDGPDLYVFEIGSDVEGTDLWISEHGNEWIGIGEIKGATAIVDIAGHAQPSTQYSFVRLQDLRTACGSSWPGADIDAVGAIGSVQVASGPGFISVEADDPALASAARVEFILDASNSMWGRVDDGRPKTEVAGDVLRDAIGTLPDDVAVGLRVYGHRVSRQRTAESCRDSELVVPVAPGNGGAVIAALDGISPRGQTPIGFSLAALREDLQDVGAATLVVLISDGIESCATAPTDKLYPPAVVQALVAKGIDFRAHVVGFDITESATRAFLEDLAGAAGGSYLDARDTEGLRSAIEQALKLTFTVRNAIGEIVAQGSVGAAPVEIPPGTYAVEIDNLAGAALGEVEVLAGGQTVLQLSRENGAVVFKPSR